MHFLEKIPFINRPPEKEHLVAADEHHLFECPVDDFREHNHEDHEEVWDRLLEVQKVAKLIQGAVKCETTCSK